MEFVKEAMGHKYSLSSEKLLRQSTTKRTSKTNKFIDEDRTFFCSELVAKSFKILGIMENDDISCSQFFPHHFSALGDPALNLTEGTWIEDEM